MSEDHQDAPSIQEDHPAVVTADLSGQLAAVTRERDELRSAANEKAELLKRIESLSRERDDFMGRVGALSAERDSLAAELTKSKRAVEDATRRAENASAEHDKLLAALNSKAEYDPLFLLGQVLEQKSKQAVAFVRSKIPAEHPALPYFDKTVETIGVVSTFVARNAVAFVKWAIPHVVAATQWSIAEVQKLLAKKAQ